jgi:molybdopterin synthase sulfur carrier subunit
MQVKVLFFGVLAEVTKTDCKYFSDINSISHLKTRILEEFPEVVHYNYRISLNNEIINNDPVLNDGDEIAFMPPFSGG